VKVLVLGAGAAWSTKDVENGVVEGLRGAGVDVGRYAYEHRLASSAAYLGWVYKQTKRADATAAKPGAQEIHLHALGDVLTRAVAHQVDWVVIVSAMFVPKAFVDVLRRAGLCVAVIMTESPYDQARELEWAASTDLAWTTERSSVPAFAQVTRAVYLKHAVRPDVHRAAGDDADVPAHDVVFVGSCFDERAEWLSGINWDGIDLGLYGNWQRLGSRSSLRAHVRGGIVDNARAAALYRRAKVGLNLYRQSIGWARKAPRIAHAESMNPRGYELAACGCFHVSQARAEVTETFGALVPTVSTPAECEAAIRQWLADDAGRRAAAAQLPACVSGDTWVTRGVQMRADLLSARPAALERVAKAVTARQEAAA